MPAIKEELLHCFAVLKQELRVFPFENDGAAFGILSGTADASKSS
jgi:lipoprotein signal peptidase